MSRSSHRAAALETKLSVLLDATRRERDLTATRSAATQTRAGVLIGAAGLVGTAVTIESGFSWIPLLGYFIAVGAGIWALIPTVGTAVPTREIYDLQVLYPLPVDLLEVVLLRELEANEQAAAVVRFRSMLTVVGFIALAIGFGVAVTIGVATSVVPIQPEPVQVEIME